ncbi:hypothetical protein Syun_000965 [Stephania yunnanensis]|uniref:Senescence regulator n=1 Tax=Stephania yunnanensis TaxID=152371 RepID=A0AAP0LFQ8_9MAGN
MAKSEKKSRNQFASSMDSDALFEFDEAEAWNGCNPNRSSSAAYLEDGGDDRRRSTAPRAFNPRVGNRDRQSRKSGVISRSVPMDIPDWGKNRRDGEVEEDRGDWTAMRIPPHEYLAKSQLGSSSFSVREGFGRTLKGRDLSRVRDAIWEKTGFQD